MKKKNKSNKINKNDTVLATSVVQEAVTADTAEQQNKQGASMSKTTKREVTLGESKVTFINGKNAEVGKKYTGVFRGLVPNQPSKYDPKGGNKPNIELETEEGKKIVLSHCGKLEALAKTIPVDSVVEFEFLGMKTITSGAFKGSEGYNWRAAIIDDAE